MLKSWFSTRLGSDPDKYIFPTVDPKEDGPDCLRDCADCTVHFPAKFHIETERKIYGKIKPFATHVLVATGKSDWVSKPDSEKGSLAHALSTASTNERLMVNTSNLNSYRDGSESEGADDGTTVLVLPSFEFIDNVTIPAVPEFVSRFINKEPSQTAAPSQLRSRPCPHDYVVLLCSHKRRDARCGISAPLIKKELERHLRPAGLYRDTDDERLGGVGIYFVSHVGGHKFSANVLVYRKQQGQLIWLARVTPENCEGIVKYTILQGKVVHPEFQLRGGFDKERGVTSW
ncbi:putative sucrase/ferredoxin domain protein [Talaromyces proteolyticus]|uniref:Sucrase/ferredoxin domain protein n=1 Tax=Talaromyces proteolyticus TaxID=1131652 RepID=A0AAD4KLC6_9EURO|nr:putative sucrase/ferredoxin domain protein [Talaromyces proteolyticus]KAH8693919.1 putative sucrase/ferredoxin domain protein [Talaromyces proteolyticus]